ncbi:putative metallopeptidase [Bacillus safensis]|uniref:hypothetical protein n=1 Tax=Bacillus safensis TaxID=561879 RepID=UPI00355AEE34
MAFVGFEESHEVRQLAKSLIDEHHPHLKDAIGHIGFYIREGSSKWAGIETIAFCERNELCQRVLRKNSLGISIFEDASTFSKRFLEEKGVALVNAIVPQHIYPILKAIVDIANRT